MAALAGRWRPRGPGFLLFLLSSFALLGLLPGYRPSAKAAVAAAETSGSPPDVLSKTRLSSEASNEEEGEPPCTTGLRDAINAAIALLHSEHFVPDGLMRTYKAVPYVPLLACPPYPTDAAASVWPSLPSLHPSDLLLRVFERQKLRVASYGPQPPAGAAPHPAGPHRASHGYDWGEEGDYSKPPYKGFLPTYLRRLAKALADHYGRPLEVEWVFYTSGSSCLQSVLSGETDMTDIYFLQGLPEDDADASSPEGEGASSTGGPPQRPPLMVQQFYRTCPVVAASNVFVAKSGLRLKTLADIAAYLRNHPGAAKVGFLTVANQRSLQFLLPPGTSYDIYSKEEALAAVRSGKVLGAFLTGTLPPHEASSGLQALHVHVFVSMGPWLRRTDTPRCLAHRFQRDLTISSTEGLRLSSAPLLGGNAPALSAAATSACHVGLGCLLSLLGLLFIAF